MTPTSNIERTIVTLADIPQGVSTQKSPRQSSLEALLASPEAVVRVVIPEGKEAGKFALAEYQAFKTLLKKRTPSLAIGSVVRAGSVYIYRKEVAQ